MVDFLKYQWLYFFLSFVVIVFGCFFIFTKGYHYSIDFVGGTNLEYKIEKNASIDFVRSIAVKSHINLIDSSKNNNIFILKAKTIDEKTELEFKNLLEKELKSKITVLKSETVGPTLGKETIRKTVIASLLATAGILLYMTFAFKNFNFAFSAIIAMIHDLFVVVGSYAVLSYFFKAEVDTMFVTAILTTMSFSVHDTIVIFDKIREYRKNEGKGKIAYYANKALTETMVRSVNNSMTIVFMLLALTLLGGATMRFFIITLLIGTVTGTYSSPFIATPSLVWLEDKKKKS